MPYVAAKPRLIAGVSYERGDVVDTSALTAAKLGSLVRVGLIIQRDFADSAGIVVNDEPPAEPEVLVAEPKAEGEVCPVCEGGPYKRLDLHMRSHEEVEDDT